MAHIHTIPGQHDITASAYVVRDDFDEPRILLHMHRKLHRLLQPGGHVELHEHCWGSIAHELEEEAGYSLSELSVLQPKLRVAHITEAILHPQPLFINTHSFPGIDHFHTDSAYLFLAHDAPRMLPADGESADLRWLSKEDILALPHDMIHEHTREICVKIFDDFLSAWEPMPADSFAV